MPKIFGKEIPTVVLGGAGLVAAYLVYGVVFPSDDAPVARPKPKAVVKTTTGETDYLDTDYSYQVAPLPDTVSPKDAFKPLVYKEQAGGGPASIDNYTYSGMAQLNGVANGLLENSQTGQGDFVQPGQHWHDHLVVQVNPDQIELKNDAGDITTLLAGAASLKAGAATAAAAAPVGNPLMVGSIGGNADISIQADTSGQQNQNGGRRRGGRRGNRGGGGGGGAAPDGG